MALIPASSLASAASFPTHAAPLSWGRPASGAWPQGPAEATGSGRRQPAGPRTVPPCAVRAPSHRRVSASAAQAGWVRPAARQPVPVGELVGEVICVLLWAAMIPGMLWLGRLAGLA